jgi:PKD repeat protein
MKVKFTFLSTATTDSIDTYYWDFGNGETSTLQDPDSVTYSDPGKYDLTLFLGFAGGSDMWIVKPDSVVVHESPRASFTYTNPEASYYYYLFEQDGVIDTGNYYDFIWNIDEFIPRTGPVQEITFPRVDTFSVALTVSDKNGCSASQSKEIAILQQIIIPNVFSPGGKNSDNDIFVVQSAGDIPLRMKIYSRTGILVYETEGPVIVWNGESASGDKMKTGVYFYMIEAISGDPNKLYTKSGFFHMYRKD